MSDPSELLRAAAVAAALLLGAARDARADLRLVSRPAPHAPLALELPLVDAPFVYLHGFAFPSMRQATALTTDFAELAHYGLARVADPYSDRPGEEGLGLTLLSAFDGLGFFFALPLGSAWHHEEWHRALIARRGEKSDNPLSTTVAAPLVESQPIAIDPASEARIKARFPADYAHVSVAGLQSHYALAHQLEKNAFFDDQPTLSSFLIGLNYLLPPVYDLVCLGGEADGDCSVQVRQLFHPEEPVGNRPLDALEKQYVSFQLGLSLLNFLDPFLATIRAFSVENEGAPPLRFNGAVRAIPTPFGQDVRLDLMARRGGAGLLVSVHNAFNRYHWFPGLDLEVRPAAIGPLRLRGEVGAWLQPHRQAFEGHRHRPGGRLAVRAGLRLGGDRLEPYAEVEGKTGGWVMGNPFLEANVSARLGLALHLF